jgi:HEAT repeat protein
MRRSLLPLLAAFALVSPARSADDTPEVNGKKLSEWNAMLRESQNARLRKVAVVSMSQIAGDNPTQTRMVKEIMTSLGKAMRNDSAAGVRAEAAKALGKAAIELMDDRGSDVGSVVIDLSEGLRVEKETDVRLEAAVALGRYGKLAKAAVPSLAGVLTDKDPKVKEAAAMALGRIGAEAKGAVDDLLPLLKDADTAVRRAAVFALGRAEPDDVGKPSAALAVLVKAEKEADMRKEVITSLGLLGDKSPDVVKAVGAALTDENVDVRRQAAKSLAKFFVGAKAASAELLKAFQSDQDKLVRAYSLRSLCVGYGEDVKGLIPHLTARLSPEVEREPEVRIAILDELGAMGPDAQPAVVELRAAQKDPETRVRDAATAAMKKVIAKPIPKPDK